MSGLEVNGGISAVISIIDNCIRIYDGAQKDLKLPEAFNVVARGLPILFDTLRMCKDHLEPRMNAIPSDVCSALEKTLTSCEDKSRNLRTIFENVIMQEGDTRMTRYRKIVDRLGKGNTVEDLMKDITEYVQHLVNNDAVRFAASEQSEQIQQLNNILQDLESVKPSLTDEDTGYIRTQNIHYGDGPQFNNQNVYGTQNIKWATQPEDNFDFVDPVGQCLLPHFDQKLFVGRESDLKSMKKLLRAGEETAEQRRLVLGGMGGIGKTQLVLALVNHHSTLYDSVFWVNSMSEATLKLSYTAIAERIFPLSDHKKLSSEQTVIHVRRWLSDGRNKRWLLVYDNHDSPDVYNIQQYYPYTMHGTIIVTSRLPDQIDGERLAVRPLDEIEHSLRILKIRSQRGNIPQADAIFAHRLAPRLEGLPLALATAGSFLQKSSWTFEYYLEEYEKKWNISSRRPLQLREYQDRTLYTTWNVSYENLKQKDPDAAQFLTLLAYFDHEAIWEELFQAGIQDDLPAWLRSIAKDSAGFNDVMRVLIEFCFLELQEEARLYSMHICVQDWILAGPNKTIEPWSYWYAFDCVANSINAESESYLWHVQYSRLATHAARLTYHKFHEVRQDITGSRITRLATLAQLLRYQYHPTAAIVLYEQLLPTYEKAHTRDYDSIIITMNRLASFYFQQERCKEAEHMLLRALSCGEEKLGSDHFQVLLTYQFLANLYFSQHKLHEAHRCIMYVVERQLKVIYQDSTKSREWYGQFLASLINIVDNCCNHSTLDDAEKLYMQVLDMVERLSGMNSPYTLIAFERMGLIHLGKRRYEEAERCFKRTLAGCEKQLGPNNPLLLPTIIHLNDLYTIQFRLEEAEKLLLPVLSRIEKGGITGFELALCLVKINKMCLAYCLTDKPQRPEPILLRKSRLPQQKEGQDPDQDMISYIVERSI